MSRFRLFVLAIASFLAVVGESFFKKSIAVGLCGILTFNSASCWGNGVSAAIANQGDLSSSSIEIAVPPRIREAPVDLQDALADDFGIVSQNPFSTGRNEILFTSPSTGVEQKYSVNLPGTGNFQLFEVEFNKVSVPNPEKLVGEGNSVFTADKIANLLQSFQINFQNNQPSEVIFADGSKAEFSNSSYVFKLPSGEVVDSVTLSEGNLPDGNNVVSKSSSKNIIANRYGSSRNLYPTCKLNVREEVNNSSKKLCSLADKLKLSNAQTKRWMRWALTFGCQALEDSTVVTKDNSREENIDAAYCRLPVECGQVANYEGRNEIRTNLFHLQPGTNRTVNLKYEFYQIPDRLEIYYNGEVRYTIPEPVPPKPIESLTNTADPPTSYLTSGNGSKSILIDEGVEYVGVKIIGNSDSGTKWNYQISCSGTEITANYTPCGEYLDNDITFDLREHIYLFVAEDERESFFNDHNVNQNLGRLESLNIFWQNLFDIYDKPEYHKYEFNAEMCSKNHQDCTQENIFKLMLSKRKFMAPAEKEENHPITHCTVSDLKDPLFATEINIDIPFREDITIRGRNTDGNPLYTNQIVTVVDWDNFSATNYTLDPPGLINKHALHPGRVIRTVVEKDQTIFINTIGEGIGDELGVGAEYNNEDGPKIFEEINVVLKAEVDKFLNQ